MKTARIYIAIIGIFLIYILYKDITGSIFLKKKDRVNMVFYGQRTVFYSLGLDRDISYLFKVPTNLVLEIPGGYGFYRIGALGKLISLERKRDIYKKAFSSLSSSFVDLYFYPVTNTIYYEESGSKGILPSFSTIFMNNSNANMVDKILLWLFFIRNSPNQYKDITDLKALSDREAFFKEFQGFFYKKTYRNIGDRVQVLYTKSYKTAVLIGNILDGEGIQVVDLSETGTPPKTCRIIYGKERENDPVPKDMQRFFGCSLERGPTDVSDIIFVLGNLEDEWEIK